MREVAVLVPAVVQLHQEGHLLQRAPHQPRRLPRLPSPPRRVPAVLGGDSARA